MSWLPISIRREVVAAGASETDRPITKEAHLTEKGARRFRMDFFIGEATVAAGITLKIQTQTGYNLWNDQATDATLTTKAADGTFTVDDATDIFTLTSHGYSDGTAVVANSDTTLPSGMEANTAYFVKVIDTNTFELYKGANFNQENKVDATDTGTGTHSLYSITQISIALSDSETGTDGQDYTPMEHKIRGTLSTGAGDSVSIIDSLLTQGR